MDAVGTAGVLWLLVSQLAVAPVYYLLLRFPLFEAVMQSLLYGGFSMFIFVTSLVARQQTEARDEQRRLNSELRATRALLAESARVNERTRISRELHDCHQLTALTLNLEVAGHLAEGQALDHVKRSHALPSCCWAMCARWSASCARPARSIWPRRCAR